MDFMGMARPLIREPDLPNRWLRGKGGERATCISCHRAHGSAEADILRFFYDTQVAGSTNDWGCLGCHNQQR